MASSCRWGTATIVAAASIVGALVPWILYSNDAPRGEPLNMDDVSSTVTYPPTTTDLVAWGVDLPDNPTDRPVEFVGLRFGERSGIDVVTSGLLRPADGSIGLVLVDSDAERNLNLLPVEGYIIPPQSEFSGVHLIIEVKRTADLGVLDHIFLRYRWHGDSYEVELNQRLELRLPSEDTSTP